MDETLASVDESGAARGGEGDFALLRESKSRRGRKGNEVTSALRIDRPGCVELRPMRYAKTCAGPRIAGSFKAHVEIGESPSCNQRESALRLGPAGAKNVSVCARRTNVKT